MATPEQNALLALQLFGAPAEQFNQQNNARTNLLLNLTNRNREEALKRELSTQGYDKAIQLANMTADREDARQLGAERRQKSQLESLQTREEARQSAAEARQTAALEAADKKQLRSVIASTYPKYVAQATLLGESVKPINEFSETWEGLGALQAEMEKLNQTRVMRDQDAASTAAVGELDDAARAVEEHKKSIEAAIKPHPEDEKFARAHAVQALQQAIETGGLTGAPKATSAAAKKGLAALSRGDTAEASSLLGSEALSTFDNAYQASMQAAPNFKGRMQQLTVAQQNYSIAQKNLAQVQSDLRKAAAGNNALATKLTARRTALQELMTPTGADTATPRTFDQITPPPPAASSTPAPGGGAPTSQIIAPAYQYPATSLRGLFERAPSGGDLAMAPANIAAFPGRVLDQAGRYTSAGLQGLYNGDFSVPDKGAFQRVGEGLGALIGGDPYDTYPIDQTTGLPRRSN